MRHAILIAAQIALLSGALPWLAAPASAQSAPPAPSVSVTGDGAVSVAPDMAVVTLGVTERAGTADAAMDAVSERVADMLVRLDGLGVDRADMQTADLSLQPVYPDRALSEQIAVAGYQASNRLEVRVRDLGSLGDVLAAVLDGGANDFSGLRFGLQDPKPAMEAARRAAVADAQARAALYADAAGVTLGGVLSIAEAGGGGGPMPMMAMAEARSVPVEAGTTEITASVSMVFALEP